MLYCTVAIWCVPSVGCPSEIDLMKVTIECILWSFCYQDVHNQDLICPRLPLSWPPLAVVLYNTTLKMALTTVTVQPVGYGTVLNTAGQPVFTRQKTLQLSLSDDDEIEQEIRNMFVRCNTLTRKFSKCSLNVKVPCFGPTAYVCTILLCGMYTRLVLY